MNRRPDPRERAAVLRLDAQAKAQEAAAVTRRLYALEREIDADLRRANEIEQTAA